VRVTPRWNLVGKYMLAAATVAACPAVVWTVINHGKMFTFSLAGLLAAVVGVYIGLRHPLWLYWGLAVVMGALPFAYMPGVHVPLYLLFAGGVLLAAIIHTSEQTTLSRLEIAVLLLVLAAGVSVVATGLSLGAIMLYIKWSISALTVIALLRLSRENLARFGRVFVCSATVNALAGIAMATFDQQQRLLKPLKIFGYGVGAELRQQTQLYVYTDEGTSIGRTIRLGGTWVLPNSAGLALVIALTMCLILFRGWLRTGMSLILLVALGLTLSRSMIFSVLAGLLLVLLFHSMRARDRQVAIGVIGVAAATLFVIPSVRDRLLSSFSDSDTGRSARADSLANLPGQMSGHWIFGLGWNRPEFKSGQLAQQVNYPSNAPLLTLYRGGIITALALVVVLVIGCVISYRAMRSPSLPDAVFGGSFIGIAVVSCNLQQSIVDMPQMTLTFSILLAFLMYVDQSRRLSRDESRSRDLATPDDLTQPMQPVDVGSR
jgi:multisubunit Na+/H+ antiporter MnhF subunit